MGEDVDPQAEELYRHRNDPGEWSEAAEPIEVRPVRSESVSFRLPSAELDALESAAQAARLSLSAYIREALRRQAASAAPVQLPVQVTADGTQADLGGPAVRGQFSCAIGNGDLAHPLGVIPLTAGA